MQIRIVMKLFENSLLKLTAQTTDGSRSSTYPLTSPAEKSRHKWKGRCLSIVCEHCSGLQHLLYMEAIPTLTEQPSRRAPGPAFLFNVFLSMTAWNPVHKIHFNNCISWQLGKMKICDLKQFKEIWEHTKI